MPNCGNVKRTQKRQKTKGCLQPSLGGASWSSFKLKIKLHLLDANCLTGEQKYEV